MIFRSISGSCIMRSIPVLLLLFLTLSTQHAPAQPAGEPTALTVGSADAAASAGERPATYQIKKGDTLWDISAALFRDPFLWPLLWQANPTITNPDLIYAGNTLAIPSLAPVERAMSAPQEAAAPVQEKAAPAPQAAPAAPAPVQKPVERAAPAPAPAPVSTAIIVPRDAPEPIVDKYLMLSAGFVGSLESSDAVIGSVDDTGRGIHGRNVRADGQEVYIEVKSRQQAAVGDRFVVYERMHDVKHPRTKSPFGSLYKVNGIVKITAVHEKGIYTAEITLSFDAVTKGNILVPYREPELIYPSKQKQAKNLNGHVIEVSDGKSISGQFHVVFLDKGTADGVALGDRFSVYKGETNESGVPQYLGDVQVFLLKERTATAIIRKNTSELAIGDAVIYKN